MRIALLLGSLLFSFPVLAERPNVLVMMADDLGYSDLGCYGSEISTPHLDRLAEGGLRFAQFYNTGRCCPSRVSLLTGAYSHRAGMGAMNNPGKGYRGQIREQSVTVAEHLKAAGYATWMVGKWHVTLRSSVKAKVPNRSWPLERGFDRFYGTMEGAKDYFTPGWLYDQETEVTEFPDGYYYERAITDKAAGWIREQPKGKPFFLYNAFYAPHFPIQAPEETVAKNRGKYLKGWDRVREARLGEQKKAGLIAEEVTLSPRPENIPAWSTLPEAKKDEMDLRMAVYAAQVEELDRGVGTLLEALDETGRLEDTLIFFLSDNGGTDSGGAFGSGRPEDINRAGVLHSTYGAGWGNASNTPYRRYKGESHEGSTISPLIVHWPEGIEGAGFRRQMTHIIDLVPTVLAAAGTERIGERNGKPVTPLQGVSLLPVIQKDTVAARDLFWEHMGNRAARSGDWKISYRKRKGVWELYDLSADPTEFMDLSGRHPEKVESLKLLWDRWAEENNVNLSR